ncbi:hypothetical protein Q31b_42890 [Novipirellula aureliae]|uniref:Uncharacterized protein n=1 Tax=Novipirellula aureliae TaxID=2527966 RepID=A0A5C6DPC9_9BACT|nr:hypothetical protein [Novipirellula aureliae]TWU37501.1 hypothetical protein Q31b_42890 [Novipirellula aureliae]
MVFVLEGRNGYLRTAGQQSVNICNAGARPSEGQGQCDFIIYLQHGFHVTDVECGNRHTIVNLVSWLVHYKQGRIAKQPDGFVLLDLEDVRPPRGVFIPPPVPPEPPPPQQDETSWIQRAVAICDATINEVVEDFLEAPYLHRVEHSIHCLLFTALANHRHFQGEYQLHEGNHTQLIHKEWPETIPRPEKANRRGNFDLAILSPARVANASLGQFKEGRIVPTICIEVGLDYDCSHLQADAAKLSNSLNRADINRGYLIHLVREQNDDPSTNSLLNAPGHDRISTVYGRVFGDQRFCKLISDANQ